MVIPTIQKIVQAKEPAEIEMDKAWYFVIFPQPQALLQSSIILTITNILEQ